MARNVYIVDDDDAVRASLQSLLSIQGSLTIRTFPSGDSFLSQRATLDPGVLLLDFHMPGASGMAVLEALAKEPLRFIAVILTGQGNVALAVDAMKAGALDFLEKPYRPAALLTVVETAFSRLAQDGEEAARVDDAQRKIATLSPREYDVLKGLIEGRPNKIIAYELDLSPRTVEIYRANLMEKLGVRSLSEALRIAFAAGVFSLDEPLP